MLNLSRGIGFLLFFLLAFPVPSFGSSGVVINEIAWMGTEKSSSDEWIELYNNSDSPVSVENWTLKSLTGTLKIILKGIIPSKGFYLLERSDDDTISSIKADLIYTGALKNTGEIIELCDNLVNPVDSVSYSSGWPAGNNETKQTMERSGPNQWQDSRDPGGTPKGANSTTTKIQNIDQPGQEYPSGVIINEVLPSPDGPDSEKEWIEIFNQNTFEIDMAGWKISDTVGTIKTYVFPEKTKILPKGFLVLYRPTTGITLNNEGDGLNLFSPDGKIADSLIYERAAIKESYARIDSSWAWSSTPTPGSENKIISPEKERPQDVQENKQIEEPTTTEKRLAAIGEPIKEIKDTKGRNSFAAPFIALTISLFSGIVILTLKKKVKQINK